MLHLRFCLTAICLAGATQACADGIDFARDIRPILSDNCFHCHGPDEAARAADLRLDTADGLFGQRDDVSIVVPGDPVRSELIRRIASAEPDERMPPTDSRLQLTTRQVELLRQWVASGAAWQGHWSFQPIVRPPIPLTMAERFPAYRPQNAVDFFVLERLAREGMEPTPPASKERLLRRVTLDLTGLPPTLDELDDFLADDSWQAYECVVERLLNSPRYGERMAWDWLDAARYADSNGFQGDNERTMWPWRDWVIRTLNENLPFDQFTLWQLAGDRLPGATLEQQLATGFGRNHMINGEGGRIPEENRIEYVFDQLETMGTIWLGMTLQCCRCHDHKFDPVTRREYYELFAFFNQTPVDGSGGNPQTPPLLNVPTREQQRQLDDGQRLTNEARDQLLRAVPRVMVMEDMAQPRRTMMLEKGLYNKPGEEVTADTPAIFPPLPPDIPHDRLELARWLVHPEHPLTARVTVNRHWQLFFGSGLVKTVEDLGSQGERPSHPELLNWLAADLIASGWDIKRLHRTIVLSATYRQAAHRNHPAGESEAAASSDPENRLLARGPRMRMPSWMLRDQALAISGLLQERIGGTPVNPYQPEGVWSDATFGVKQYVQGHGEDLYRRSLYTFWRRIVGPTVFFDAGKRQTCTVKVSLTNTPLHALTVLNDVTYLEAARVMAQRLLLHHPTDATRLATAFRLATSRSVTDSELRILMARLEKLRAQFQADPEAATQLLDVGESARDRNLDPIEHAAYTGVCSLLLNLDETLSK